MLNLNASQTNRSATLIRFIILFCWVMVSCGERGPSTSAEVQTDFVLESLPAPPESDLANSFGSVKRLYDVFEFAGFIKLKEADDFYLEELSKAIFVQDHWVVLDRPGKQVLVFDGQGSFVRQLGRQGSGPGEYESLFNIEKVYDDGIGVRSRGRLTVYELSGDVRTTLHNFKDVDHLILPSAFQWQDADTLWLFNVTVQDEATTRWCHAKLQKSEEGVFQISQRFGQRFLGFRNKTGTFGDMPWFANARVRGNVWLGSPHASWIDIYDPSGQARYRLWSGHPNGLTYEDFEGVNYERSEDAVEKVYSKYRNQAIVPVDDLIVLTKYSSFSPINAEIFNLYTSEGALLQKNLTHHPLAKLQLFGANGRQIYGMLAAFYDKPEDQLGRFLQPQEIEGLKAAGWRQDDPSHFYIWTARLQDWVADSMATNESNP